MAETEKPKKKERMVYNVKPKTRPGETAVALHENPTKPKQVTGWIKVSSEPGQAPPPELDGLLEEPPQRELWPNLPKEEKD
jgi:hypothetical protein